MRLMMLAILPVMTSAAFAGDIRVDRVDVLGEGIYEITIGEETPNPDLPGDTIATVQGSKLIEATSTVQARLGLEFGYEYVVVGEPDGADVSLDAVYRFPSPGLKDPESAEPTLESRVARKKKIGEPTYIGYGFDNDWEIVPGTWTFEIWYEGRKLAGKSFTVTK